MLLDIFIIAFAIFFSLLSGVAIALALMFTALLSSE
jgi:hypothetical protein